MKRNQFYKPTINLDKVWSLVSEETLDRAKTSKDGKAAVIDVTKAGFFKVLGKGDLPKIPVIIRAKEFSKHAEKRIQEAGGACQLIA